MAKREYDAGKKVVGRKRNVLVDVFGLILAILVLPANVQDRDGGWLLLVTVHRLYPSLTKVWADGAYAGDLVRRAKDELHVDVEIVKKPPEVHTFKVLPRRWVVERTFGWLNRERRLSKDYERLPATTETFVHIAMVRLMARNLSRAPSMQAVRPLLIGPTGQKLPNLLPAGPPAPKLLAARQPLPELPPAGFVGENRLVCC